MLKRQLPGFLAPLLTIVLSLAILPHQSGAATNLCSRVLKSELELAEPKLETPSLATKPGRAVFARPEAFEEIAQNIHRHRNEFTSILSAVDNYHGAQYEIGQVLKTLAGVKLHEQVYLNQLLGDKDRVKNVAVYGSTNIPLYTLILHALLPASTGAHVWFRTPAASRHTYVRLFQKLQEINPQLDLSMIHILTEPSDVQYDNFRKQYVLGMNRKGNRYERGPADVVLFTGNPKTGEEVKSQIEKKLSETASLLTSDIGFRGLLFLKFGAGLNPVIVTNQGRNHIEPAVNAAIEAIRINSSQDCIAPKFYVIHESMAAEFEQSLLRRIKNLKFGERMDDKADYSNLTFTETLDGLETYRKKWSTFLTNPEAVIDSNSKRVDPHVFSFTMKDFENVDLVDHYAPFLVIFKYRTKTDLERIANDPRIRDRAMFASVFGDASSTEMVYLRKLFEDNFHTTVLNQSIFTEESGNFPFGGYSASSSTASFINLKNGQVDRHDSHRPLLYSKEAAKHFGSKAKIAKPGQLAGAPHPSHEGREQLAKLIRSAQVPSIESTPINNWSNLKNPHQELERPQGLSQIRKVARQKGLWRVVNKPAPRSKSEIHNDTLFYGPNRLYGASNNRTRKHHGVAVHPTFIGHDVPIYNLWRGEMNPLLGVGYLNPHLFSSKANEYILAQGIWPGSMPRSTTYEAIVHGETLHGMDLYRANIIQLIKRIQNKSASTELDRAELLEVTENMLKYLFAHIHHTMPEGAFIKNFGEFTTGDMGNQITSFSQNERNYARQFVEWVSESVPASKLQVGSTQWKTLVDKKFYQTGTKLISKLLSRPEDLLIQQRVVLAKTNMGMPLEVRVDFVDGESVHSRPRYTHEYLGPEMREAEQVLNLFFSKAPEEIRRMSGGADLAKLEDGTWMFMEFNFGSNSGTLHPELFPIESNLWLSKLGEIKTPLIEMLDNSMNDGVSGMRSMLESLNQHKDIWQKSSIAQMSRTEVAKYFRDRMLDRWLANGRHDQAGAAQMIETFKSVVQGMYKEGNRELELLIMGMENAVNNQLLSESMRANQ